MTPTELLIKYGTEARYAESDLAAKALAAADLPEDFHPEALRRLREQTHSIILQSHINDVLDDGWVATPENSMVQPYRSK